MTPRFHASLLLALTLPACLKAMPTAPTMGYGAPYAGTGKTIFVKDSRTDWDIHEGNQTITAEQALEASGDPEYETRRQLWKSHNAKLQREAGQHRRRGYAMIGGSVGTFIGGLLVSLIVAPALANEATTAATPMLPESRITTASGASIGAALLGTSLMLVGLGGVGYGYYGAKKEPEYLRWRIPDPLNRPAYIRRFTEEYNAKLEHAAPAVLPGQKPPGERPPGLRPPPGSLGPRQPGPPARAMPMPRPRGGRR